MFIYLKNNLAGMRKGRSWERSPVSLGHSPNARIANTRLGPNQEPGTLPSSLLCVAGAQAPQLSLLPPRTCINGKLDQGEDPGLKSRHSDVGCRHLMRHWSCTKHPAQIHPFNRSRLRICFMSLWSAIVPSA